MSTQTEPRSTVHASWESLYASEWASQHAKAEAAHAARWAASQAALALLVPASIGEWLLLDGHPLLAGIAKPPFPDPEDIAAGLPGQHWKVYGNWFDSRGFRLCPDCLRRAGSPRDCARGLRPEAVRSYRLQYASTHGGRDATSAEIVRDANARAEMAGAR